MRHAIFNTIYSRLSPVSYRSSLATELFLFVDFFTGQGAGKEPQVARKKGLCGSFICLALFGGN